MEGCSFRVDAGRVWGKFSTIVTSDPSLSDLVWLVRRAEDNSLRGCVDASGVYVWPAWDAIHGAMKAALGLGRDCAYFWVVKVGVKPFSPEWSTQVDTPIKNGIRLVPGRGVLEAPAMQPLLRAFT